VFGRRKKYKKLPARFDRLSAGIFGRLSAGEGPGNEIPRLWAEKAERYEAIETGLFDLISIEERVSRRGAKISSLRLCAFA
jgi:hypothetical protein